MRDAIAKRLNGILDKIENVFVGAAAPSNRLPKLVNKCKTGPNAGKPGPCPNAAVAAATKPKATKKPKSPANKGAIPKAGDKISVAGGIGDIKDYQVDVKGVKDGKVQIGETYSPHVWKEVPLENWKMFVNDLTGRVDVPADSGNPAIDAVASGKGRFLGKGQDGLVFQVGDKAVKVSTIVPLIPTNPLDKTPAESVGELKRQSETTDAMIEAGVPGLLPTEFVEHGGKGFQVRPLVDIPDKLTAEQLDKVGSYLDDMHEKGYSLNDEVQVGIYKGEPVLFDTGAAAKMPEDDARTKKDRIGLDKAKLENLYDRNGVIVDKASRAQPAAKMDALAIKPDNIKGVWGKNRDEILQSGGPQMTENQAGSLAAARILNAVGEAAGKYREEIDARVRAGEPITDEEDDKYMEAEEARKNIYQPLANLSGYRPHELLDDHPEAKKPLV